MQQAFTLSKSIKRNVSYAGREVHGRPYSLRRAVGAAGPAAPMWWGHRCGAVDLIGALSTGPMHDPATMGPGRPRGGHSSPTARAR